MNSRITRRRLMTIAGAVSAGVAGLLPERQLVQAGSGTDAGEFTGVTMRDFVLDEVGPREARSMLDRTRSDPQARPLWAYMAENGLAPQLDGLWAARGHFAQVANREGFGIVVPVARGGVLVGKLVVGRGVDGQSKTGLALQGVDGIVEAHTAPEGVARRNSTVRFGDGSATVTYHDGATKVVPVPRHVKPKGLASLAAGPCNVDCFSCAVICGTTCSFACGFEAFVVCAGADLLCPPCGLICNVFFLLVCGVVCSVGCFEVCTPCC